MPQMMMMGGGVAPTINDIAGFNPYAWLNAMSYAGAADSLVTTHANAGSLGGDFSNSGGTVRPTYRATGVSSKPAFQFDGGDYFLLSDVALSTFTCIALFKATANGFIYEHSVNAGGGDGGWLYTDDDVGGTSRVDRSGVGASQKRHTAGWGITGDVLLTRQVHTGTHSQHALWVNGVSQSLTDGGSTVDLGAASATQPLYVGARNGGSVFLTGHIAQLIFFTPALSDANAAAVEAILTSVYGL